MVTAETTRWTRASTAAEEGELLDRVVDTITANREQRLATMMDEEFHLQPVGKADIIRSSIVITLATLIGHMITPGPFFLLARTPALTSAFVLGAAVLFGVGAYSAETLVGNWRRNGTEMILIGLGAAVVGYAVSSLFTGVVR
jgi:VIT1/CCC1 family predicted Fe2+/Mn2+ transporter